MRINKIILVIIFSFFLSITCFAQSNQTESLTITTYYPAPYGVYRDLIARKSFAVGNYTSNEVQTLNSGQLQVENSIAVGAISAAEVSNLKSGQFYVGNSVIYKPVSGDPDNWSKNGPQGEMAYSSDKKNMYFFNGVSWSAIGSAATPTPTPAPTPLPTPAPTPAPVDPPGTIKGAITIVFHKNGGNACGYQTCTSTAPGQCVAIPNCACPGQCPFYSAACSSGWRVISTGSSGTYGETMYYSCQKQ